MIQKIEVTGIGPVTVYRRKGMRSIRISVSQSGVIKLSLPFNVSLQKGLAFLQTKKDWVTKHAPEPLALDDGATIGRSHTLRLHTGTGTKLKSVRIANELHVYVPEHLNFDEVQTKLQKSAKKLIVEQAEALLLPRLQTIADASDYHMRSSSIALLKSRWGSCNSTNDIVLNGYLVQLPSACIDYVIWHELAHTKYHDHSDAFWQEVAKHMPNYKTIRKLLKKYPTAVFDSRENSEQV